MRVVALERLPTADLMMLVHVAARGQLLSVLLIIRPITLPIALLLALEILTMRVAARGRLRT